MRRWWPKSLGSSQAGFFCAGEVGPIGGQKFLHGFTASIAVFVTE
jgi:small ligand-binding sensory domain FIST